MKKQKAFRRPRRQHLFLQHGHVMELLVFAVDTRGKPMAATPPQHITITSVPKARKGKRGL
jgi:hypothetical protein